MLISVETNLIQREVMGFKQDARAIKPRFRLKENMDFIRSHLSDRTLSTNENISELSFSLLNAMEFDLFSITTIAQNFYDLIEKTLYQWIEDKVGRKGQGHMKPYRNDYKLSELKRIKNEINKTQIQKINSLITGWGKRLESIKIHVSKSNRKPRQTRGDNS